MSKQRNHTVQSGLAQYSLWSQNRACNAEQELGGEKRRKDNVKVCKNMGCARDTIRVNQCDFPLTMKLQEGPNGNTHMQTLNSWNLWTGEGWWDSGHRFGLKLSISKQHNHLKNPWTLFLPCCLKHPYFSPFNAQPCVFLDLIKRCGWAKKILKLL